MEAFGLLTIADYLKKDATCLISVSDSKFEPDQNLTAEERQTTLNQMIFLALESIIKTK
jgi:purine-nucleoside phosphorylase